ncbi:hypothetical protein Zmor_012187 [Zophobas morio]|uniref:Uncharacterized protein n=1 Tax=Zophobas morio TaxID=2755281 RepID=A0AA38LYZ7_9CUCU|nr:hypothetical protein Zmor_012187 [Zophobas morio]
MLTTPLQINSKVSSIKGNSANPDYYMKANAFNLTSDFIYNYFLNDEGKKELTYHFDGSVKYDVTDDFNYSDVFGDLSADFYQKNGLPEDFDYKNINESNIQDPDSEIFFRLIQRELNKTIYTSEEDVKADKDSSVFSESFIDHIYSLKKSEEQEYILHLMKPALDQIGKYENKYN